MLPWRRTAVWSRFVVSVACMWLAACAPHFERPALSVAKIEYQGGNILQQNFLVTFNIYNPNSRSLPVSGVNAELSIDGDRIASGSSNRAFEVAPRGDTQVDMTIKADFAMGLSKLLKHSDSLNYELNGAVSIDLPLFRSLPFHETGVFALSGPPRQAP
jgi:LEA14-like dessication related protein